MLCISGTDAHKQPHVPDTEGQRFRWVQTTMVGFIAATVKAAIPNIMQWIKPTAAKPADAKIKNSTLSQVFGFLLFFMIYIGYRRIVWASVIVILVAAFAE